MKYTLLGLLFFFAVLSCNNNDNAKKIVQIKPKPSQTILGSWRLFDVLASKKIEKPTEDKLLTAAMEKEIIRQGLIISFFKDGSFSQLLGSGAYKTGTWRYQKNEHELYLTSPNNIDSFSINLEIINNKNTVVFQSHINKPTLKFMQSAFSLQAYEEDPFYSTNNTWRIKPSHKETTAQIQERLANYLKHLVYILKASKERKASIVSFEFSQGIVKIYSGGIGINPQSDVPNSWKDTYYNYADALVAYNMFKTYLQTSPSYKGAGTGNWIEDDYNILVGMYGDIKQGKYTSTKN